MADGYMASHKDVTIEMVDLGSSDYMTVLATQLAGSADLDIVTIKDIPGYANPVSYTHLDVYKRQWQFSLVQFELQHFLEMQGDLIDRFRPCGAQARVGDRHRDVYKRQGKPCSVMWVSRSSLF